MKRSGQKSTGANVPGGALLLISMLMIGSALVRVGVEARPAPAQDRVGQEKSQTNGPTALQLADKDELDGMLRAFMEREAALQAREREMEDRLTALALAEAAIERQLAALEATEEQLRATIAGAEGASESDLESLTTVYESMKPKDAAVLFEEMEPEFAAGFLARMRPEAAAGVLAGLSPEAAYSISVVLAGRNFWVPTE